MEKKLIKNLPLFELKINECSDTVCDSTQVDFISMVQDPAISMFKGNVNFVAFSNAETKKNKFKIQDAEKHMLCGPLMIPDLKIYRKNPEPPYDEYYVFMSSETIEASAKNWMKKQFANNININHDKKAEGAYLFESWIKTSENDKSNDYGFKCPIGTWFGTVYCPNEEIWSQFIKEGTLKGFSVEGDFITELYDKSAKKKLSSDFSNIELSADEEATIDLIVKALNCKCTFK